MLGKRKRRDEIPNSTDNSGDVLQDGITGRLQTLFRQHFETNFEPIESLDSQLGKKMDTDVSSPDTQSESDWDGCSSEGETAVEVVHHYALQPSKAEVSRAELTTFTVSKFINTVLNLLDY